MKDYGLYKAKLNDTTGVRKLDFYALEPDNEGNITVRMTEQGEAVHYFVITEEAIRGFHNGHPIKGRYALPAVIDVFYKKVIDFCCHLSNETLIMRNRCKEIITSVYAEENELVYEGSPKHTWVFSSQSQDGDTINSAYGDEVRYCAFMEAFRKALADGSRGGHYEWLYRAICYAA